MQEMQAGAIQEKPSGAVWSPVHVPAAQLLTHGPGNAVERDQVSGLLPPMEETQMKRQAPAWPGPGCCSHLSNKLVDRGSIYNSSKHRKIEKGKERRRNEIFWLETPVSVLTTKFNGCH